MSHSFLGFLLGAACDAHADTSNTISRASWRVEPARVWNAATRSSSQPGDAGVLLLREREMSRKVRAEMHGRGQGVRRETGQRVKNENSGGGTWELRGKTEKESVKRNMCLKLRDRARPVTFKERRVNQIKGKTLFEGRNRQKKKWAGAKQKQTKRSWTAGWICASETKWKTKADLGKYYWGRDGDTIIKMKLVFFSPACSQDSIWITRHK